MKLFAFKSLTALHLFGGYLEDKHGRSIARMATLESLSIYGEYVLCPYFDHDTFRMYTQSPMKISDRFFAPFIKANRKKLKYLEFVDYSPIDDYEILEVWSEEELIMFQHLLPQVNLRATKYTADTFRKFLTGVLSKEATTVQLCLNAIILSSQTIEHILTSCPRMEE